MSRPRLSGFRHWGAAALVVAGAAWLAAGAAPAHAGTYTVRQCDATGAGLNPAAPDAVSVETVNAYAARDRCGGGDAALRIDNLADATDGREARWDYAVPAGAELTAVDVSARLNRDAGHRPTLYVTRPAGTGTIEAGDTDGYKAIDWSAAPGAGWTGFSTRLRCEPGSGSDCPASQNATARVRNIRLEVNDVSAPTLLLDGALVAGGWRRGTQSLAVSARDAGGGVHRIEVEVNGDTAAEKVMECATIPGSDSVARTRPCESDAVASFDVDTDAAPFRDGTNAVEVCVEDFGSGGVNRTCTSRTVRVDNHGPGAPENLRVVGGDGWRSVNSFDVEWENPEQPAGTAPLDAAWYRIEDENGVTVGGPGLELGQSIHDLDARTVPAPGHYTMHVWLRDEAGNASEADSAIVNLRFDDAQPAAVALDHASGWLSRRELVGAYVQTWSAIADPPVSGIQGYAVAVDGLPNTNPCETTGNPDPVHCSAAEITHTGTGNRSQSVAALPEGSSWVHVAAVSGSGVRSASVSHVELRADRTDPVAQLAGAPSGWSKQPATLVAHASDVLSGMQPAPGDDGQPRTCIEIDGGSEACDPDNEVVVELSEEGDHGLRYWARDLAGNENDGDPGGGALPPNNQPATARVRLDMTPPQLGFQNAEDAADPELIRAPVADQLSGVEHGQISYRPQGTTDWQPLATSVEGGTLEARMPGDALPDGLYELRAEATDRAGNATTTTRRQSGDEMIVELPLKVQTELTAKLPSGGGRDTIGYGREALVEGRVFDAAGEPVAFADVTVIERFALGSVDSERTRPVITDGQGRYGLVLPAGPSREVEVAYEGSRTHTQVESDSLELGVRGDASLKVSKRRPRVGQRFRFAGRVRRRGAEIPPGGKLVELQVKRPEGWDTVRQAFHTNGHGRWRFAFRFGPYYLEPTTFRFRLKVLRERGWPYRLATTGGKRVTVIPRR